MLDRMNSTKRDKQHSLSTHGANPVMSISPRQHTDNGKYNGSHKGTSHHKNNNNVNGSVTHNKKEKGVVEKLLNSYGFLECASSGSRVFFHYSEYDGDPNDLNFGDCMEFSLTTDPRNHKLLAVKLVKLPPGTVVIETLSEEEYIGKVEMEPRHPKNGDHPDASTSGRVSYDKNGEFFFLPFTINDTQNEDQLRKGDVVSFHIATNKRSGVMRARKVKYVSDYKQPNTVQGIVSSLKESFGFIERADVVAEIFFHYSEFNGDVNELMIGDDVDFQLVNRLGKEIAVKVNKLDPGTVVFEDISTTRFRGHVLKAINTRLLNNSVDGHLTGMIEYQGKTDTHEVLFGDRDTEDDIQLQKGDVVEFNVSTDRRDNLQRAVNIKLISVVLKDGQKRDVGVVTALKEGFGFIKCAEQELSIFFHFSEILEQSHILDIGQEVEFTIENDSISRRQHATRIRFLPKGSVSFESVSTEKYAGVVEQEASTRNMKSPNKQKELEYGIIRCIREGKEVNVFFNLRDCRPREVPRFCDKVEFILVTKKANHQLFARDISILEKYEAKYQLGFVCALKESYGFIEAETHDREVFFHYSELDVDPNDIELGDGVKYVETKKGGKRSAEGVTRVQVNPVDDDDVQPTILDGVILRPMRTVDPEQEEYEGLLQLQSYQQPDDGDEKVSRDDGNLYTFGITDVLEKKEALQKGDKVNFQMRRDKITKKERPTNISCKRNVLRGKVESMKGQFGFISYDSDDGKSVFFHMSEVQNNLGKELKAGDDVRFVIVQNHKNAKRSAVRVQKMTDERPEHLSRRRSTRLSESTIVNKVQIVRQPSGPDGSKGFKMNRSSKSYDDEEEEEDGGSDQLKEEEAEEGTYEFQGREEEEEEETEEATGDSDGDVFTDN